MFDLVLQQFHAPFCEAGYPLQHPMQVSAQNLASLSLCQWQMLSLGEENRGSTRHLRARRLPRSCVRVDARKGRAQRIVYIILATPYLLVVQLCTQFTAARRKYLRIISALRRDLLHLCTRTSWKNREHQNLRCAGANISLMISV